MEFATALSRGTCRQIFRAENKTRSVSERDKRNDFKLVFVIKHRPITRAEKCYRVPAIPRGDRLCFRARYITVIWSSLTLLATCRARRLTTAAPALARNRETRNPGFAKLIPSRLAVWNSELSKYRKTFAVRLESFECRGSKKKKNTKRKSKKKISIFVRFFVTRNDVRIFFACDCSQRLTNKKKKKTREPSLKFRT